MWSQFVLRMKLKFMQQVISNQQHDRNLGYANGTIRLYSTLTGKVAAHSMYVSMPKDMSDEA